MRWCFDLWWEFGRDGRGRASAKPFFVTSDRIPQAFECIKVSGHCSLCQEKKSHSPGCSVWMNIQHLQLRTAANDLDSEFLGPPGCSLPAGCLCFLADPLLVHTSRRSGEARWNINSPTFSSCIFCLAKLSGSRRTWGGVRSTIYVYVHVYLYTYGCMWVYVCTCVCVCVWTWIYVQVNMCVAFCVQIYVSTCVCESICVRLYRDAEPRTQTQGTRFTWEQCPLQHKDSGPGQDFIGHCKNKNQQQIQTRQPEIMIAPFLSEGSSWPSTGQPWRPSSSRGHEVAIGVLSQLPVSSPLVHTGSLVSRDAFGTTTMNQREVRILDVVWELRRIWKHKQAEP